MPFSHWGATVTESSTRPCEDIKPISQLHGHVADSVTGAPLPRFQKALALRSGMIDLLESAGGG